MTTSNPRFPPSLPEIDLSAEAEHLEALAALADGRLDDARRAQLLAQLSDDAESLDLLAEVMALRESEELAAPLPGVEGEPEPEVVAAEAPGAPGRVIQGPWGRQAWLAIGTLAAAVLAVVWAPRFLTSEPTPQSMMAALDPAQLDSATLGQPPWSPLRGGVGELGSDVASPRDSFRWGVLAADLEAALRTGRDDARQRLGPELERVLPGILGSWYDDLTDPDVPAEEALSLHGELQDVIESQLDPFYYRYGLFTRAAWWAAASGQPGFFRGASMRSLGALEPPEAVRDEWRMLRAELEGARAEDLPRLAIRLEEILRDHAG